MQNAVQLRAPITPPAVSATSAVPCHASPDACSSLPCLPAQYHRPVGIRHSQAE